MGGVYSPVNDVYRAAAESYGQTGSESIGADFGREMSEKSDQGVEWRHPGRAGWHLPQEARL